MTPVDYDRDLYRTYRAGRALAGDTGRLWMDAIAAHLGGRPGRAILDLGAGTGRFSGLLADAFGAAGFGFVALDTLEQEIDPSLQAHYERLKHRALSTFALITDAQFEAGLTRMRHAAELESRSAPVVEAIDLLVLRRTGS